MKRGLQKLNMVFDEDKRLDLLVNCAGFEIFGALEFTNPANVHRQLKVNLFGVDNSCKAAIPLMRSQGFGRIVNISSAAAGIAIPFQGWYSISKAGINAYTPALVNELRISLSAFFRSFFRAPSLTAWFLHWIVNKTAYIS